MRTVLLTLLIAFASCTRDSEKTLSITTSPVAADARRLLDLAKGKQMFLKVHEDLDMKTATTLQGSDNVTIFMVKFKDNPNRVYAINTLGNELIYSSMMQDDKNGSIGLMKDGEAIIVEFTNGSRTVKDISNEQFGMRYVGKFHGGNGFCQRERGESFGSCFQAESNEFCNSFISCVALATRPEVAVVIGLACSCNA